ncbi:MAG: DUF4445 domain-containing protein [Deltaproteobacteria bacterium]|nr:DUF4445 domain-containing protein [Deltaproteobacteria bacterium]
MASIAPTGLKYYLELPKPSLSDNTADLDRLRRGLKQAGFEEVIVPYQAIGPASRILRQAGWRVTASLRERAGRWRLIGLEEGDVASKTLASIWEKSEAEKRLDFSCQDQTGAGQSFGLAIDLGTTTLALALVELASGRVVDQTCLTNPQVSLGADILTRLHAAAGEGLSELQRLALAGINQGIDRLLSAANLSPQKVTSLALAGNTTMTHLFLGLDPAAICREPYIPVVNRLDPIPARVLGLSVHPQAPVFIFPNVGSYFGGDVIAGLVSSGLAQGEGIGLLVDVGTNAEVVVGNKEWLMACAGAAGPALEGGVAKMGMPAGEGAIEGVRIDRASLEPQLGLIGPAGVRPAGICGSGLIELVAELYLCGVIDIQARILPFDHPRLIQTADGWAYLLAEAEQSSAGSPILFSQIDLDILLRSKAAMFTILTTLLDQVGLTFEEIETFYVAGAFGQHIDPSQAIVIGMLPDLPLERYVPLGNAALAGARQALISAAGRNEAGKIRDRITYLELNVNQEFMNLFSAAKFLPHTDRSLFPSVPEPGPRAEARRD